MTYDELNPRNRALLGEAGADNYTVVSARLVRALRGNGNAAIFLAQLLWWARRKEDEDGWFYRTREQMKQRCGLGETAQRSAEKVLKSLDLLKTDRRGMPAKKHYSLNYDLIVSLIAGDEPDTPTSGEGKSSGLVGATSHGDKGPEQVTPTSGKDSIPAHNAGGRGKNNTQNNTRESAPACEDDDDQDRSRDGDPEGVVVWVDVTGERPPIMIRQQLKDYFEEEAPKWEPDTFRDVLREAYHNVGRDGHRIKLGYLFTSYEKEIDHNRTVASGPVRGDSTPLEELPE